MGRRSIYPLVDRILDGALADHLAAWRAEGLSVVDMSYKLRSEYDVQVSPSTIHRWLEDAQADTEGVA